MSHRNAAQRPDLDHFPGRVTINTGSGNDTLRTGLDATIGPSTSSPPSTSTVGLGFDTLVGTTTGFNVFPPGQRS